MTKEDLRSFDAREKELRQLERVMHDLRERMESPLVSVWSHAPAGIAPDGEDRLAGMLDRLRALFEEYNALWDEQIAFQREIELRLAGLTPTERGIFRLRHIERRPWVAVGRRAGYAERQAQRILARAEEKMLAAGEG